MTKPYQKLVSAWYVINYLLTNNEVRDHDLMAGKYRSSAHKTCKINLNLTKAFILIFHNVRDYDSHLIMQKLSTFDIKIDVIPNGLEKYIDFIVNKNSDFVDSIQFMYWLEICLTMIFNICNKNLLKKF